MSHALQQEFEPTVEGFRTFIVHVMSSQASRLISANKFEGVRHQASWIACLMKTRGAPKKGQVGLLFSRNNIVGGQRTKHGLFTLDDGAVALVDLGGLSQGACWRMLRHAPANLWMVVPFKEFMSSLCQYLDAHWLSLETFSTGFLPMAEDIRRFPHLIQSSMSSAGVRGPAVLSAKD